MYPEAMKQPMASAGASSEPSASASSAATPPATAAADGKAIAQGPESSPVVRVLDVGCGFGGLLFGLLPHTDPSELLCGLEIRLKVSDYVRLRILAERRQGNKGAERLGIIRTNAMKFLPAFFQPKQLRKLFICFPDPYFKRKTHPRRIVSPSLVSDYAHLLQPGGRLYTVTDVGPLHGWMAQHLDAHPSFRRLPDEEAEKDPCVGVMRESTEESKKARREGRGAWVTVHVRLTDAEARAVATSRAMQDGGTAFWDEDALGSYGGVAGGVQSKAEGDGVMSAKGCSRLSHIHSQKKKKKQQPESEQKKPSAEEKPAADGDG